MKITGQYTLDAPRDEVWAALNDIDVLARVVPGCERLDQHGEHEFEGTVKIGIQAIKGVYHGRIRLEDLQPPTHYKLVANGKSSSGVVDGVGTVDLEDAPDGKTLLRYGGEAQIGGVLASVGQRLIEGASRQLINQSLKALAEQINLRRQAAQAPVAEPMPTPTTPEPVVAEPIIAPVAVVAPVATTAPAVVSQNGTHDSALTAEVDQAGPAPTPTVSIRKSVVVPESEQLKPESVVSGMVSDMYRERPWIVWVAVAFVIGYLLGKSARR